MTMTMTSTTDGIAARCFGGAVRPGHDAPTPDEPEANALTPVSSVRLSVLRSTFVDMRRMTFTDMNDSFVVMVALEGEASVMLGEARTALLRRQAVLLGRGEGAVEWQPGSRALILRIPRMEAQLLASARHGGGRRLARGPLAVDLPRARELDRWIAILAERNVDGKEGSRVLEALLDALAMQYGADAAFPPSRSISVARAYLDARKAEAVGLDELALKAGVTPVTLQRGFKACLGVTVAGYGQAVRLHAARARLRCGWESRSIAIIARGSGFQSVTSFARAYQKLFGETPTRTRMEAARINNVIHNES